MVMEKDEELRALTRGSEKIEEKMEALKKELALRSASNERLQATLLEQRQELDAVKGAPSFFFFSSFVLFLFGTA